jgi:hypothetical protein
MSKVQIEKDKEAQVFGKYILGKKINDLACYHYYRAVEVHHLTCTGRDKKLENFILRFPFWIGFVDAALEITDKKSVFRNKLFVMLAVLETIPEYSRYFLSKKYSMLRLFIIAVTGIRSVYRLVIGFFIIQLFRRT